MPNAGAHRVGAAIAAAAVLGPKDSAKPRDVLELFGTACTGALFGTFPDKLEPPVHPKHRQFFHGFACAGLVGLACYRLYHWHPDMDGDKAIRFILLIGGIGYLTHLAMDALTPGSLPLVGRA